MQLLGRSVTEAVEFRRVRRMLLHEAAVSRQRCCLARHGPRAAVAAAAAAASNDRGCGRRVQQSSMLYAAADNGGRSRTQRLHSARSLCVLNMIGIIISPPPAGEVLRTIVTGVSVRPLAYFKNRTASPHQIF